MAIEIDAVARTYRVNLIPEIPKCDNDEYQARLKWFEQAVFDHQHFNDEGGTRIQDMALPPDGHHYVTIYTTDHVNANVDRHYLSELAQRAAAPVFKEVSTANN